MQITNLYWYKGKDILANQKERGRDADLLHFVIAAWLSCPDEMENQYRFENLVDILETISAYAPVEPNREKAVKELGF